MNSATRQLKLCATAVAFALLVTTAQANERAIRTPGVEPQECRPGESFPALTVDGAWNWCQDPKAVTIGGSRACTYTGWVDSSGDVVAAAYDHATGRVTTSTLRDSLEIDDHNNPAFLVWPDGDITAFFTPHGGVHKSEVTAGLFFKRTAFPEHVEYWEWERALDTNTDGRWEWTYPNVALLSDEGECGRVFLFWRGGRGKPALSISSDGTTWTKAVPLVHDGGGRPYLKIASDGIGTIHIAVTDGHPRGEPTNSIYYLCYHGGAFFSASGEPLGKLSDLPLSLEQCDVVYDGSTELGRAWLWDVATDGYGDPVVAFASFPDTADHRYRYAVQDEGKWRHSEICSAGGWVVDILDDLDHIDNEFWYSGGLALDHSEPGVVYLSRPAEGVHEIERWMTLDGGSSWTSEPVTCESASDNTRPCVPRGHVPGGPGVIWMNGEYRHYRDFETAIRMRVRTFDD